MRQYNPEEVRFELGYNLVFDAPSQTRLERALGAIAELPIPRDADVVINEEPQIVAIRSLGINPRVGERTLRGLGCSSFPVVGDVGIAFPHSSPQMFDARKRINGNVHFAAGRGAQTVLRQRGSVLDVINSLSAEPVNARPGDMVDTEIVYASSLVNPRKIGEDEKQARFNELEEFLARASDAAQRAIGDTALTAVAKPWLTLRFAANDAVEIFPHTER